MIVAPVVLSAGVALFLRSSVVQAFKVPSGSMMPTILFGDHFFVDMRARSPRRGEPIVFRYPERPEQEFVKRVVAGPGDELIVRGGKLSINGWEVPSCRVGTWSYQDDASTRTGDVFVEFLERSAYLVLFDHSGFAPDEVQGPYRVPDGEWWVMGDNRFNSHDSRMWFGGKGGGVPTANVRGRATTIWSSTAQGRFGVDLSGDPPPPSPELAAPLAACLASRPPPDKATPPARR
jgi:signal peptidase I